MHLGTSEEDVSRRTRYAGLPADAFAPTSVPVLGTASPCRVSAKHVFDSTTEHICSNWLDVIRREKILLGDCRSEDSGYLSIEGKGW